MGFSPVQSRPNCATRYAEIAWISSGADMPQRSYMLATTVSQSRFCRLTTVTRSRLWQTAQRVSTSSLPGPLGSAAAVAAGAPGPKLVMRYWMTVSASRGVNCAPRSTVDVLLGAKRRGGAENERKHADEHETPHGHTLR